MAPTRHSQSSRKSSPYPSVDSASEYSPEAQTEPNVSTGVKRRSRSGLTPEERREARAHRNRLAAQCSRDRKKVQFSELAARVAELEAENRALRLGVHSAIPQLSDSSVVQENAALKARVQQLELAWQNMARLIGSMPLVQAQPSAILRPPIQPLLSFPLSPAPTTLSAPESLETPAEPTCESARFANVSSLETSLQRVAPSARHSVLRLLTGESQTGSRCSPRRPRTSRQPATVASTTLCC
jgi:bZIP transcription factor